MDSRTSGTAAHGVAPRAGSLRAWAELARVSNLPTCLSNTLVGCAIGAAAVPEASAIWPAAAGLAVGIGLLYVAGMALNDVADQSVDRIERPQRPIPSGRIRPGAAAAFVVVTFVLGLLVIAVGYGTPALLLALLLVGTIVAYDLLHKRWSGSVVLMGICRGLVYLVTAAGIAWPFEPGVAAWLAATLALYTIAITVVARTETGEATGTGPGLALMIPLLVLLPALHVRPESWIGPLVAGSVLAAWLVLPARFLRRRPPQKIKAVLTWLSGMCLVDAWFLTLLGDSVSAGIAVVCFAVTVWGHRHVMGT